MDNITLSNAWTTVGLVCLLLVIAWASTEDYEDEIRERIAYCKAVGDGVYPDYKHTFEQECKK